MCYEKPHKPPRAMNDKRKIYEGKAKILFEGPEPHRIIQHFKDDATAFNNKKHAIIAGKGVMTNYISASLMTTLNELGIPTHFIKRLNMREQLVEKLTIIPLEVVIRNVVSGSLCRRLPLKEGTRLARPLVELYYKNDQFNDPLVNEDHILICGWAEAQDLEDMVAMALRINDILIGIMTAINIDLIDFKLEFGRRHKSDAHDSLMLADEISPDNCRLWDKKTGQKLDKDLFRYDLGDISQAYNDVGRRLGVLPKNIGMSKQEKHNHQIKTFPTQPKKHAPKS